MLQHLHSHVQGVPKSSAADATLQAWLQNRSMQPARVFTGISPSTISARISFLSYCRRVTKKPVRLHASLDSPHLGIASAQLHMATHWTDKHSLSGQTQFDWTNITCFLSRVDTSIMTCFLRHACRSWVGADCFCWCLAATQWPEQMPHCCRYLGQAMQTAAALVLHPAPGWWVRQRV